MRNYDQSRQHIKKQRHYFSNKGPSSQSYGFSNSYVWIWELDHKESWAPKNWSFWSVVLETLESPLDGKIQPVNPKGNQSLIFTEGLMLKLKLQYFGHLMQRTDSLEKIWCWERLKVGGGNDNGWDSLSSLTWWMWLWVSSGSWWWTGKPCCSSWGHMTEGTWLSNWTELSPM